MKVIDLSGKVALVTGAKQGIGYTVAVELAKAGAQVAVLDLSISAEDAVCKEIEAAGVRCLPVSGDVCREESVKAAFDAVKAAFGRLDILINNAGITKDGVAKRMSADQFEAVLRVNLTGTFLCARESMALMREGGAGGAIVNFSSIAGFLGNVGQVNYSATKAGVVGMTRTLALEGARDKIRVNAVVPGFISTAMTDAMPEEAKKAAISRIPLARMGTTGDVADSVLFLVSELSSFITGHSVHINGGRYM